MELYVLSYMQDTWYDCAVDENLIWVFDTLEGARMAKILYWKKEDDYHWYYIDEVILNKAQLVQ